MKDRVALRNWPVDVVMGALMSIPPGPARLLLAKLHAIGLDIEAAGLLAAVATSSESVVEYEDPRRVAMDLLRVFGAEQKAHGDVLCARLAEAWPERYEGWEPVQLSHALRPLGVRTRQIWATGLDGRTTNRQGVWRGHVATALAGAHG